MSFRTSKYFWVPFLFTGIILSAFFAWELGLIEGLPQLPRSEANTIEIIFTISIIIFASLNVGLFMWQRKYGSCPRGTRRATTLAGTIGAVALLCPVCLLLPVSILGVSISLVFLSPFLPLLRLIALILLIASSVMLWPRKT